MIRKKKSEFDVRGIEGWGVGVGADPATSCSDQIKQISKNKQMYPSASPE